MKRPSVHAADTCLESDGDTAVFKSFISIVHYVVDVVCDVGGGGFEVGGYVELDAQFCCRPVRLQVGSCVHKL